MLGGPQPAFCDLEEHNALTAHQERERLASEAGAGDRLASRPGAGDRLASQPGAGDRLASRPGAGDEEDGDG